MMTTVPDTTNVIVKLPDSPEEVGVVLPSAELRRIDFSALEFETARRMAIEYIKTYFKEDFNDFVLSNGTIMFVELVSALTGLLSERSDIVADESFLPTAQSRTAVSQHLELIGQKLTKASPAVVDVECIINVPASFDIVIPAGLIFSLTGPDGGALTYELFKTPGDYTGDIIIPRGKRGIVAYAVEGKFGSDITVVSDGSAGQYVDIMKADVIDDPIIVSIETGSSSTEWSRIDFLEQADANSEVFEVDNLDDRTRVSFGDNKNGKAPIDGQLIRVRYRNGGGIRGRIGRYSINESRTVGGGQTAATAVTFRNPSPSRGGYDNESLDDAKKRAPREFSTHKNIATSDDYSIVSSTFKHPVYGSVSKSVAVVRTGIEYGDPSNGSNNLDYVIQQIRAAPTEEDAKQYLLANYVNKNVVDMYLLQEGETMPIAPSNGLKTALSNYISQLNVFTDELRIYDGSLLPVNLEATVVLTRNADAATVKEQVLFAVKNVFSITNRNMGQEFNRSDLIFAMKSVDGVKSVDVYKPTDDYPSLRRIVTKSERASGIQGVGVNELIVLGSQNIQFYLEQGNINI
jgi:hypothetical protein